MSKIGHEDMLPENFGVDELAAQDVFISHYLAGLAIVIDPFTDSVATVHNMDPGDPDCVGPIITHAKTMMLKGLKKVVSVGIGEGVTFPDAEKRYNEFFLPIRDIIAGAYDNQPDRIRLLDASFPSIRPNPLVQKSIYTYICHSRNEKIRIGKLYTPYSPHPVFDTVLSNGASGHAATRIDPNG